LLQPASMDAFELEYDFVHVRAFTYILSISPGKMIFAVLELWMLPLHWVLNW